MACLERRGRNEGHRWQFDKSLSASSTSQQLKQKGFQWAKGALSVCRRWQVNMRMKHERKVIGRPDVSTHTHMQTQERPCTDGGLWRPGQLRWGKIHHCIISSSRPQWHTSLHTHTRLSVHEKQHWNTRCLRPEISPLDFHQTKEKKNHLPDQSWWKSRLYATHENVPHNAIVLKWNPLPLLDVCLCLLTKFAA